MGEKRKLIVQGGAFRRRTGARIVAVTKATFVLKNKKYIEPCERAFIEFEEVLRERPDSEVKYEWEHIYRSELRLTFDLNWYDLEFFHDRKNAYRVGPHAFAFQRFGADADDFILKHKILRAEK